MWIEVLAIILVLIMLVVVGFFVWRYLKSTHNEVDGKIKQVVDKFNSSSEYIYKFDKQQEQNIKNLENNVNSMFNNYAYVKNETLKIKDDYISKGSIAKQVDTDTMNVKKQLQVGNMKLEERAPKTTLARADGKNWLFLYSNSGDVGLTTNKIDADTITANNMKASNTVTVGKDWNIGGKWNMSVGETDARPLIVAPMANGQLDLSKRTMFVNGGITNVNGGITVKGGNSVHNPNGNYTMFPNTTDNKNYVRGDTNVDGQLKVAGPLCLGDVCLKATTNGGVQACNSSLRNCKNITMTS